MKKLKFILITWVCSFFFICSFGALSIDKLSSIHFNHILIAFALGGAIPVISLLLASVITRINKPVKKESNLLKTADDLKVVYK